jgi:ABC-type nickel/cobalt efflux system permease component RcnA
MIGTGVGLFVANIAGDNLILVTAGGFIYLATVNILPDILNENSSLRFRLAQILFFGIGIAFLYAVSLLEEMEGGHSGHGHGHSHGHQHHEHHDHSQHAHHDHHAEVHDDHHNHDHGEL